jgi:hypothetical protein
MLKGGSGAAGGGHRISASRWKRPSTKPRATRAQARAHLLNVGAAVGFGARPAARSTPLSGGMQQQEAQVCLVLPGTLQRNGAGR